MAPSAVISAASPCSSRLAQGPCWWAAAQERLAAARLGPAWAFLWRGRPQGGQCPSVAATSELRAAARLLAPGRCREDLLPVAQPGPCVPDLPPSGEAFAGPAGGVLGPARPQVLRGQAAEPCPGPKLRPRGLSGSCAARHGLAARLPLPARQRPRRGPTGAAPRPCCPR